ncbi:hypothetical protein CKA32_001179 [Geitlerinema sp. FC II]|nr:hypothetical protein CKA32_001179 [Geitlerinema sp. FC II]
MRRDRCQFISVSGRAEEVDEIVGVAIAPSHSAPLTTAKTQRKS